MITMEQESGTNYFIDEMVKESMFFLREKILTGFLLPGDRLPSTRVLADDVNLARNTVVNAYNQLLSEGFLDSTVGSGTIVSASLPEELTGTISSSEDTGILEMGASG